MAAFEPKIVAFLCNWCAYAGADLAGVSRLQYPSNLRPVRVMCSGRVDPTFIVDALDKGADGVLVAGWHLGDCHYLDGNVQAQNKIRMTRKLLDVAHIGPARLHLAWVSSAEAQRFARITEDVVNAVKECGPLDRDSIRLQLEAVRRTLDSEPVRWTVGKQKQLLESGDVYGRAWEQQNYEALLDSILRTEYEKNLIFAALKQGSGSIRDINAKIGLELPRISFLVAQMEKGGLVELKSMQDNKPQFAVLNQ